MKRTLSFLLLLIIVSSAAYAQTGSKAETALALLMEGNFTQAKKTATEIIAADKNNPLAYAVRASGEVVDNNMTAAQADFEKAVKLSPGNGVYQALLADCYRIQRNTAQAGPAAEKAIGLLPVPKSAMEFYARALASYVLAKTKEALADYTQAIQLNPRFVRAYAKRAFIYVDNNQNELALTDFSKAIELNPQYAAPYFYRGNIYYNLQKYELAIADYSKAIQFDPKDAGAYINRGVMYKKLEKYDNALSDYTKAIELNPKDADAYNNRGHVYYIQQKYELAMAEYNKAIAVDPAFANSYVYRGNTYTRTKQPDLAITDHTKAIQLNPKYFDAYMERGHIYYNNKMYDQALKDYSKAVEIAPKDANAYLYLAFVHHDKQQFSQALTNYNRAIELDDKNMYAYSNRAEAYDAIGNTKQANLDRKKYSDLGGKITATGGTPVKSIFPQGTFDPALAKAGLARGLATIRGRACSKFDGLRFDAAGAKVVLFPVTPYLEEWYELREKKEGKKTSVYMSTEANQYRVEAYADNDGRFVFEGLKPGKYFIQIIHSFNQAKTARIYTGSDTHQNGPVRTTTNYYYDQDYTVARSKRFEKFVEIKEDGETKKITLTSGLIKSCAF